ncbi:MAG: cytochrome C oxidase subunit IV family protein [bacterium]|nr:cytochrome C oxidase subunit IV family protein [bacterium]
MSSGHQKTYFLIWAMLIFLTGVTVAVSYFDFGIFNIYIAMLIATVKASLVALFFMHLIEDSRLNQVVFISSLVFLFLFVLFTVTDTRSRPQPKPMVVMGGSEGGFGSWEEIEKVRQSTPELVARGNSLYAANCVSCHGVAGKGDGPAATTLKPVPRDFSSGYWKFGGTPVQVFKTVTEGSPGTAMAGYSGLSVQDRFALVHYVRSIAPHPLTETSQALQSFKALVKKTGGGEVRRTIPIHWAMKLLAEEATQ